MDSDERLTALKKAYADIILNTAKEAASRIMVSEKKTLRYQHELCVAKEDALQMLVRLKHTMDVKVSEAEMKSFSQQEKIDELEAQLQEAEDIVKDLRDELREVQAELERMRINKVQHWNEHDTATLDEIQDEDRLYGSEEIIYYPSTSPHESIAVTDVKNSDLNQGSKDHECYNSISHTENSYTGHPNLPSVSLRSEEPQLCRNGCTQRIRACERNLLDGELSMNGHLDDKNIFSKTRVDEEGKQTSRVSTRQAYRMLHADSRLSNQYQFHLIKSYRTRKRATGYKKKRTALCRHLPGYMKTNQPPNALFMKFNPHKGNVDSHSEKDTSKIVPRSSLDMVKLSTQSGSAETTERETNFANECGITGNKINEAACDMMPTSQENASTVSLSVPACTRELETADVPLLNSVSKTSKTTSEIGYQPANDRIIKYTFQRKRKKESISSPDRSASLERITSKKKMGEKQNGSLEPQKSSLITESSRDIQRQAEVARQLLSLSEEKWWH